MPQLKILVVDDADVILTALKNFLEEWSFEVITCRDGLEGILKAVEHKPDLMILDLMMPNLDGFSTLKIKKDINEIADIPVIVISAKTDKENVVAAINAGADKVISKPLRKDSLTKSINEVLGDEFFLKIPEELENDEIKIKRELIRAFVVSFTKKKRVMLDAIYNQDKSTLYSVVHEIKGAGGTIGHPRLTEIALEIEQKVLKDSLDWVFIEKKSKQIIEEVLKIEKTRLGSQKS